MKVALVSQRSNQKIPRATSYEHRDLGMIIPILQLSQSKMNVGICREDCGRVDQLVHQLNVHSRKLQHYQHASMIDYHEFKLKNNHNNRYDTLVQQIENNGPRITGITSMDFCFSTPTTALGRDTSNEKYLLKTLSYLFLSLRELDLTNTCYQDCV